MEAGALPEYAAAAGSVLDALKSSASGLTEDRRAALLASHGPNRLPGRAPEPWWKELAESFTEPMQLLLIAVAVLSGVFGEPADAWAIGGLVLIVGVIETTTEQRAARAIHALKDMTAPEARVLVGSRPRIVPADTVVPGDVLVVEAGDVLAADARVLSAQGLCLDESSLTGEPHTAAKGAAPVEPGTALAERSSMLYAGTPVAAGEGLAVVTATGAETELGRMGRLVQSSREPATPLQKGMGQLARWVLGVAVVASVAVPLVGLAAGQPWQEMVLTGLTVAFATVPEELPILVTVLLAVGGRHLARRGALVRRLKAAEALGSVTMLLTDKTGTLTENRLHLARIEGTAPDVLRVAVHTQAPGLASREPLEEQLREAARQAGIAQEGDELSAVPFNPARKIVSRAWTSPNGPAWLAVAGAPEAVIDRCVMNPDQREAANGQVRDMAERGLRVLAFARRELQPGAPEGTAGESGLTFVGLAGFEDPLREGVPASVKALEGAGVGTLVVTGDHPATAQAIAAKAGLRPRVITGIQFDAMDDTEAQSALGHGTVIARATPATKHRAVRLLQGRGEVVAVTGDGANDAPALAAADVGIALGLRGTELAKEAAGIVLTDDAYPTVVEAVAKGRNIGAQLRRAVAFYLGAKLALVAVMLTALAAGLPAPFQPVHIIVLEVFMDLGASMAFVGEPSAPSTMARPPRNPRSPFLNTVLGRLAAVAAALFLAAAPAYLLLDPATDPGRARTGAMLAWLAAHALIAWTLRTRPALPFRDNPAFPLWAAAAIVAGLSLATTPLGALLGLATLDPTALGIAGACAVAAAAVALLFSVIKNRP